MQYSSFHSVTHKTDPLSCRTEEHYHHFHKLKSLLTYRMFCSTAMRPVSLEVFKLMFSKYFDKDQIYLELTLSDWALDYLPYLAKL